MTNNKGLSLVEMLISLIVASIMILTIGVLSSIAHGSFNKLSVQSGIYNDVSYGFKLLQYKVRGSSKIAAGNKSSPWIANQHFLVGNSDVFGLQTNGSATELVYFDGVKIKNDVILSVPQPGTVSLKFCNLPDNYFCELTTSSVKVYLSGTKKNIPFHMQTTIYRRNP